MLKYRLVLLLGVQFERVSRLELSAEHQPGENVAGPLGLQPAPGFGHEVLPMATRQHPLWCVPRSQPLQTYRQLMVGGLDRFLAHMGRRLRRPHVPYDLLHQSRSRYAQYALSSCGDDQRNLLTRSRLGRFVVECLGRTWGHRHRLVRRLGAAI